jgi:hypothetical protein
LRLGSSTMATPLAPFPSKGSPAESQAGLLARGSRLLSAPSQGFAPQWPVQISVRIQLRGSDGFTPSSLLTVLCCEATWLSSTINCDLDPMQSPACCQDKFCWACGRASAWSSGPCSSAHACPSSATNAPHAMLTAWSGASSVISYFLHSLVPFAARRTGDMQRRTD